MVPQIKQNLIELQRAMLSSRSTTELGDERSGAPSHDSEGAAPVQLIPDFLASFAVLLPIMAKYRGIEIDLNPSILLMALAVYLCVRRLS